MQISRSSSPARGRAKRHPACPLAACALALLISDASLRGADSSWNVGTPIVTYWAGPPMTDSVARQMKEGGWNLVWCAEKELDVAQRHGLRAQLTDALLSPKSLETPAEREKLDALVARVRSHPALYAYFLTDEPNASQFPALGKLVAYLRERDPGHLAYINLFPTYATNEQLGNQGDTVTAYRAHLHQYVEIVKPALISYDHYQFAVEGDTENYFLNLSLIRRAALDAGLPFLNIVQACTWTPSMRVPTGDEMRYLIYTTLAYGAQGISYYVYCHPGHTGGIALADGTPTPLYEAVKSLNLQFVAIASQLQGLRSIGVYHEGVQPPGTDPLPEDATFRLFDPPSDRTPPRPGKGVAMGLFGPQAAPGAAQATHIVLVNLDYRAAATVGLSAPAPFEVLDAIGSGTWMPTGATRGELRIERGGGRLVRVQP
ncbi:MAG TPA: hypothetical protein PK640_18095 [Verrucomicrobiota bacterium]|nr:hypothetical protein [Verrucomicrobiota bacterium]